MDGMYSKDLSLGSAAMRKKRTSPRRMAWWRVVAIVGTFTLARALLSAWAGKDSPPRHELPVVQTDPELIWNQLPQSGLNSLLWVSCYSGKQCARLMVPSDYSKPDGPQVGIALIKVPSRFAPNDEKYRGPILFNPGGPGGSGISLIYMVGDSLQKLVGDEFDIIGFDPRGVARTTPSVSFFEDDAEAVAWALRLESDPVVNTTADALSRMWARARVQNSVASRTARDVSPYVSTALVARDMLNIMRAHGRDKLQYWGFSYGTVLGATFAAMFPENVERLIIDGVEDSENYYNGLWDNNLLDTDKALRMVLDACVAAGPSLCHLYEPTADKVHARLTTLYDNLKKRPLPVYSNTTGHEYGLIDYKTAWATLFAILHNPYGLTMAVPVYPSMLVLNALAQVEKGNGLDLARILGMVPVRPPFSCKCPGDPDVPGVPAVVHPEATIAIACSDADAAHADETVEDLEEYFARIRQDSEFADLWSVRVGCAGWKTKPVERFAGPFVANTSFPLLIIGNTADPVTPLAQAWKMSRGFNGSVVLHQDSAGHCTLAATSLCTAKAIRAYFREGKLPENGTVCGIDSTMFPPVKGFDSLQALQGEDRDIINAWTEMRSMFEVPRFGRVWKGVLQ